MKTPICWLNMSRGSDNATLPNFLSDMIRNLPTKNLARKVRIVPGLFSELAILSCQEFYYLLLDRGETNLFLELIKTMVNRW